MAMHYLRVLIIDISIIVPVPTSLHADFICVKSRQVEIVDQSIFPYIRRVAVCSLAYVIAFVNEEDVPL